MKSARALLTLSAASMFYLPAAAQPLTSSREHDLRAASGTSAMVFLRIPLGGSADESEEPRFGFGLYAGCAGSLGIASEYSRAACDARPLRAIELSTDFSDVPWALSFGGAGRRSNLATWSPHTGALSFAGPGDNSTWLWIGVGAIAVVGVAAALGDESDSTLCTGNTVPNPLSGACEPLRLN